MKLPLGLTRVHIGFIIGASYILVLNLLSNFLLEFIVLIIGVTILQLSNMFLEDHPDSPIFRK